MNKTILHYNTNMYIYSDKTNTSTHLFSKKHFLYRIEVEEDKTFGSYSVNSELRTFW